MKALNRRQLLKSGAPLCAARMLSATAPEIQVRAFNLSGGPAAPGLLDSMLLADASGRPFELLPKSTANGTATIGVPPERFEIMMVLPIRGFGQVFLYADNGGALYTAAEATNGELGEVSLISADC